MPILWPPPVIFLRVHWGWYCWLGWKLVPVVRVKWRLLGTEHLTPGQGQGSFGQWKDVQSSDWAGIIDGGHVIGGSGWSGTELLMIVFLVKLNVSFEKIQIACADQRTGGHLAVNSGWYIGPLSVIHERMSVAGWVGGWPLGQDQGVSVRYRALDTWGQSLTASTDFKLKYTGGGSLVSPFNF